MNQNTLFNPRKMLKAELIWIMTTRCNEHGRPYSEHPGCLAKEQPLWMPSGERVGFLDIESTNLKANFGYVISWAIKELGKDKVYSACVRPSEIRKEARSSLTEPVAIDHRVLRKFYETVMKFDKVCVYWGKNRRHDIPFLRHRCLKAGVSFPLYKEVLCIDVYDMCKNFLSLHSYRLEVVCNEFAIPAKGHKLTGQIWVKSNSGNKLALDHILSHNIEDVVCLEPVYKMLEPFTGRQRPSI
jgi:uncharacterized protein YprB with RNaseH-like and TPR domain